MMKIERKRPIYRCLLDETETEERERNEAKKKGKNIKCKKMLKVCDGRRVEHSG